MQVRATRQVRPQPSREPGSARGRVEQLGDALMRQLQEPSDVALRQSAITKDHHGGASLGGGGLLLLSAAPNTAASMDEIEDALRARW